MRNIFAAAAVALAIALPAGASFANDLDGVETQDFQTVQTVDPLFDLGVDVTGVAHTTGAVAGYLTQLEPVTRASVLNACETFMAHPDSAQDRATIGFCSVAVGG
jgi:hypothetical protein